MLSSVERDTEALSRHQFESTKWLEVVSSHSTCFWGKDIELSRMGGVCKL